MKAVPVTSRSRLSRPPSEPQICEHVLLAARPSGVPYMATSKQPCDPVRPSPFIRCSDCESNGSRNGIAALCNGSHCPLKRYGSPLPIQTKGSVVLTQKTDLLNQILFNAAFLSIGDIISSRPHAHALALFEVTAYPQIFYNLIETDNWLRASTSSIHTIYVYARNTVYILRWQRSALLCSGVHRKRTSSRNTRTRKWL